METYPCPGPAPPQTAHEGPHPMCPECGPDYERAVEQAFLDGEYRVVADSRCSCPCHRGGVRHRGGVKSAVPCPCERLSTRLDRAKH